MPHFSDDRFWNSCLNKLAHSGASELVANGPGQFFITMNGIKQKLDAPPMSERAYAKFVADHIAPLIHTDEEFDEQGYLLEGRYEVSGPEGFEGRCHIVTAPASYVPLVTMTKISGTGSTIESIAASGSMTTEMMNFLIASVRAKLTIVLSGQSGAGKTTTLQALSKYFSDQDRIGVGEDIPEIRLSQPNCFYLHSVPWKPGFDPNKTADLSWVVKQFLRMRLDRGIIGETRGKEFADFLVAANSGMDGSMTTIHANDPSGALDKMTRFALQGSELQPIRSINKEIGSAVDLVVQLARIDGKHRVTHIQEITNTVSDSTDSKLASQTIYGYDRKADNWEKKNVLGDKLKDKFALAGIDIRPFLSSPVGSRANAHQAPLAQTKEPGDFQGNPFGARNI